MFFEILAVELYLGSGVDELTIESTPESLHVIHVGEGNDMVLVKDIPGALLVYSSQGDDYVTVTLDAA